MFGHTNKDTHSNIVFEFEKAYMLFILNHYHHENPLLYTKEPHPLHAWC